MGVWGEDKIIPQTPGAVAGSRTDRNMAGSLLLGNCLGHPFCHLAGGLEMSWGAQLSSIHLGWRGRAKGRERRGGDVKEREGLTP